MKIIRHILSNNGLIWLGGAKSISAACSLLQALVFSLFLSGSETQSSFYFLAVISCLGQAAIALPVPLISQHAWLSDEIRVRKYFEAFVLFSGTLLVLAAIWLALPITDTSYSTAILVIATAFFASIPNLFSIERFSVGDLKQGAMFNVLNVLVPQGLAAGVGIWQGTAIGWLVGLLIGHIVVVTSIVLIAISQSFQSRPSGNRDAAKLNTSLLFSTSTWLLFTWSLPNLPRIVLSNAAASTFVAQLLVLASLSFAFSNAIETLIAQLRRREWLGWFETEFTDDHRAGLILRELSRSSLVALILVPFVSIAIFLSGNFLLFRHNFLISFKLIILIVACDFLRSQCSISYLVSEAGRMQARLAPFIAVATVAIGGLLVQIDAFNSVEIYLFLAIALSFCYFALVRILVRPKQLKL